jgi:hypothetical protein
MRCKKVGAVSKLLVRRKDSDRGEFGFVCGGPGDPFTPNGCSGQPRPESKKNPGGSVATPGFSCQLRTFPNQRCPWVKTYC